MICADVKVSQGAQVAQVTRMRELPLAPHSKDLRTLNHQPNHPY